MRIGPSVGQLRNRTAPPPGRKACPTACCLCLDFADDQIPRTRHDGWTAERQALFIAALRLGCSVTRAADAAGMSRKSAYALRRRSAAARFAAAWDLALRQGDEGYAGLAGAIRAGRVKVTRPAPAKVTMVTRPAATAHTVNRSQVRGQLAPRPGLP